jgi:replication factor C large subunit
MDLTTFGVEGKKEETTTTIEGVSDSKLDIDFTSIKENFLQEKEEKFLPWFLKYQLNSVNDLFETKEIKKVREFFDTWKKEEVKEEDGTKTSVFIKDTKVAQKIRSKGLLLVGMPGSGKTTTLTLFGEHYKYEIYEMNASDARNKKSINEHIVDVIKQKSLFGGEKLLLIDEADGVSGTNDRGGLAEIVKLSKESPYPLVFTANDKTSDKIKAIKKITTVVDFEAHSYELLEGISKRIFEAEQVEYKEENLQVFIEDRDSADIRGFINDLQSSVWVKDNKQYFEINSREDLELRTYKKKIEQVLEKIFYSYPEDSLKSSFNSDVNLDDLMLYLEENIPMLYRGQSLNLAFNELAKADIFKGRIYKWQYWRYLVYINFYATFGISTAKGNQNLDKVVWKKNGRILKKWMYGNKVLSLQPRTKIQKKKDEPLKFIEKLAKKYSCSVRKARVDTIPYIARVWKHDANFKTNLIEELEMTSGDIKVLDEWRI